jgi:hypothetical protein
MPHPRPKPGIRSIQKRLLIFCEGKKDKSEYAYFNALIRDHRNPDNRIEVKVVNTKYTAARELVKAAQKFREYKNDNLWVVFDKDGYTLHKEAFDLASKYDVHIAFSSICFEYWILLHYEYTTKAFSCCDQLVAYLKSRHNIKYEKSDQTIYKKTKQMLETAKGRARQCRDYQRQANSEDTAIYELNPYTNIDELICTIEEFTIC